MTKLLRFRSALLAGTALVLPVGGLAQTVSPNAAPVLDRVVSGGITVHQDTAQTVVQQGQQRGIVDWRSFNVGQNHAVTFQQPGASSVTLNRVTTPDPSTIAGRISANGQVVIVNQSGVVFTQGAQVDAAGLIVSSANITNENFMAGRMVFDQPGRPDARIENAGTITIREAGLAALVAPQVANRGTITARLGRVALAGGETHVVDLYGDGLLSIEVTGAVRQAPTNGEALVTNAGVIEAQGGTVQITAAAADGIVQNLVRAGGRIAADTDAATGRTGGITINGTGGAVRVEGEVRAVGTASGTRGGRIEVVADRVLVDQGAVVNASGTAGGGEIALGNTLRGSARPRLAQRTGIAQGANLRADATERGDGGTIVINSQDYTAHGGSISARGGPQGGNGGFVEVSGQGGLLVLGTIDAGAPAGEPGTILIDPVNLTIIGEGDTLAGADQASLTGNVLSESAAPDEAYLYASQFQSLTGDVILQASNDIAVEATVTRAGGNLALEAGRDITVNATMTGDSALTLTAGRDIATNAPLQFNGGITLDAGRDLAVASALQVGDNAPLALFARSGAITISAGQITGNGGTFAATAATDLSIDSYIPGFNGVSLTAQSGNVVLQNNTTIEDVAGGAGITVVAGNGIQINGGVRLVSFTLSTDDVLDLQAGQGGITQTGSVYAGTLQVRTTGDALLDFDPGLSEIPSNAIATLGASNVAGAFSLRAGSLDAQSAIAVDGLVHVGGRLTIEALAGISQVQPSVIDATELLVSANDAISLLGDNTIATVAGLSAPDSIDLRNVTSLVIAGPVEIVSPNFYTAVSIVVDGGDLTVAAPISATAQEGYGYVSLAASGNLAVTTAGSVTADGPYGGYISLAAAADAYGYTDPSLPGALTIAGNVSAVNGSVYLSAGLGGIVQTAGGITTGGLSITSGGDALLTSSANAVGTLYGFEVAGTLELDNGVNDLFVTAGPPSESYGQAENIGLRTGGTVTFAEGMEITATNRLSLRVGALVAEDAALATADIIEIAPFAATPMVVPLDQASAGVFGVSADVLSHLTYQSLRLGATTFGGVMTTTADGLSLAAPITVPAMLDLRSLAGITQDDGAAITAATLTGASATNTVLIDPGNLVTTLAGFAAGGDFDLFTQGPLLSVPAGNTVYAGGALTITVGGGGILVDGTVTGGTTSLIADDTLTVNGFSAIARDGSLLLQAPVFTLDGLAQASGDIIVQATTSASLAGYARTANTLSITSPSVTFGGLDAQTADVWINLGLLGYASGALDAGGLLVQGGSGALLTGTIAGIAGRPAAAVGRRATEQGVLLPDPPPEAARFTFNDCAIGASACAAVTPTPPPTPEPVPPAPEPVLPETGCVFGTIACANVPLTLLNPAALLAVLDPAQVLDAVDQLRPPTPDLALQPTRDPTEDSELAPPDIRGGDY